MKQIREMSSHPSDSLSHRNSNTPRFFVVNDRLRRPDREHAPLGQQTDHLKILGDRRHRPPEFHEQIGVDAEPGSPALTGETGSAFSELPQTVGHRIRLVDDPRYPILDAIPASELSSPKSLPTANSRLPLPTHVHTHPLVR